MWFWGCQSFVAILRAKGSEMSLLMVGITSLPFVTARLPFYVGISDVSFGGVQLMEG
jgi:hypothetical protein